MAARQVVRFPVFSSGEATSDTVSPSAYMRNIAAITRETTVIDRTRERFIVIAMTTLLLLISLTLFGILFTLLSEDFAPFTTVINEHHLGGRTLTAYASNTRITMIAVNTVTYNLQAKAAEQEQGRQGTSGIASS